MYKHLAFTFLVIVILFSCSQTPPPAAITPLPTPRQIAWHEMEFYGFVHFNMNTFTNMEWGLGGESPALFNPTALDCRQWARVCKEAGMKGIILTAKHHDGFCLWPSEYTEHSVKNSPWKNGQGDVVQELADACKEYGLKLGLYLSPWDRNHADYGTDKYLTYFKNQLAELTTKYGDVFEVWFDGANGGTGYYGGANEERKVDRKTYYDWPNTRKIVRENQPMAMMFSDAGPDVRWVGNESGWAGETNWSILRRDEFWPGSPNYKQLTSGHEDGTHWLPAEVDVSIRPGWYYHKSEDHKVRSVKTLVDIYYNSIGRNASFLLNFPVDARGVIHENDVDHLMKMVNVVRKDFETNLAAQISTDASNVRGNSSKFRGNKTIDGNKETYWSTDDEVTEASLVLDFGEETTFNRFLVQEYIPLGQRVQKFSIEYFKNDEWKEIDSQTTIGYKRILRFDNVTSNKLRFNILAAKGSPTISNIEIYHAPKLLEPPAINRDKNGIVTMESFDTEIDIYFTKDGSVPTSSSEKYSMGIEMPGKAQLKAIAHDPATGKNSPTVSQDFDICKAKWKVVFPDSKKDPKVKFMVDSDEGSIWRSPSNEDYPHSTSVDLGEMILVSGFTYLPTQQRYIDGTVSQYKFFVSTDGKNWNTAVSSGEFSNIKNNPILQTKNFESVKCRYIKFVGEKEINDNHLMTIAELGILTE